VARLNDDAQWIVLMGFLVSFSFFFLAMVINQSTVVGQTTAESVIEFPKNDIRDIRDVTIISLNRKNAVVSYDSPQIENNHTVIKNISYNNGVTEFNENWTAL
jgi:hypothetical protein